MWTGQAVMVLTLCVALTSALRNSFNMGFRRPHPFTPRCPSASKPCRTKAIMNADFLPPGTREIHSPPCSCPESSACSDDWEADQGRVITRELHTNGNISMTFSMMFCGTIQPQSRCTPGQVSLQLSGWSPIPTEVDFINCSCPERRPLVLHSVTTRADHRQYHSYVCGNHKRRCKRRHRNRDRCMETNPTNHTVTYPCKCSRFTSCLHDPDYPQLGYTCRRSSSG
ncbi:uncharacterized protein LOC143275957 [Babylonia areolata]|uniref:uncharacterized protein LOC143275957 n=1 Tax=Babylonia areolata TaxID=304850 RepID=UPI003FD651A5